MFDAYSYSTDSFDDNNYNFGIVEDQQGYSYEDQIADRHQKKLKLIQDKELILIMTLTTPTF